MPAALKPRDAATLIVVDRSALRLQVLMGRRRPGQVFLPDTFVFPGGRVEPADRALARRFALPAAVSQSVQNATTGRASGIRASALALAAIRETFEESGFVVGEPEAAAVRAAAGGWTEFFAAGYRPRLDRLELFARAITPPARPRRYDTRFFLVDAAHVAHRSARTDGELLDIDWFTLEQARTLPLPSITRHVIEDIAALERDAGQAANAQIPFYFHRRGQFCRTLIARAECPP
jgi:8-oxo-dGTP pyrophosphatase MutT (NUDIX family)